VGLLVGVLARVEAPGREGKAGGLTWGQIRQGPLAWRRESNGGSAWSAAEGGVAASGFVACVLSRANLK
jgi:hypothetical protein